MVWTQESYHNSVNCDRPGECSPEKDCFEVTLTEVSTTWAEVRLMTLMMTSAQVVETSVNVTSNSPSQDYTHPDDHNLPNYDMLHYWQKIMCITTSQCKKSNLIKQTILNSENFFYHTSVWVKSFLIHLTKWRKVSQNTCTCRPCKKNIYNLGKLGCFGAVYKIPESVPEWVHSQSPCICLQWYRPQISYQNKLYQNEFIPVVVQPVFFCHVIMVRSSFSYKHWYETHSGIM